jgi:DNA invertase Pin-like site-specific DNA recombinase
VARHVAGARGVIVAEYQEIESGSRSDRPEIAAALAACRLRHAVLIIAKLDRLARNVAFISNLMESGVEFVACDNPHATRLTIHILAAVAEHEREMISQRTKAALAAAKARGVRLGNPHLAAGNTRLACAAVSRRADRHTRDVMPYIEQARKAGARSLGEIAEALINRGVATAAGGELWDRSAVRRVLARAARLDTGSN